MPYAAPRAAVLEAEDDEEGPDAEGDVDLGDVDLAELLGRGVAHGHPRAIAKLNALLRQREGAGDERLRGDDGRRRRHDEHRIEELARHQEIDRVRGRRRVAEEERPLPEVVQDEGGEDEPEPGGANRPLPEVAHIRVERLGARDGEDDGTEREKSLVAEDLEEAKAPRRVERHEDVRVTNHLDQPDAADGEEPDQHHRTEEDADAVRPRPLHREDADDDAQREGDDERARARGDDLEPLHRPEDGHRRGDDAIAVEQGGAEERERDEDAALRPRGGFVADEQGEHREDPALPSVVGTEDEDDVLHADHEDQRPEHEGEDAVDSGRIGGEAVLRLAERLLHRVERARPDVPVDDAEGGERQDRESLPLGVALDVVPLGRVILRRHRQRRPRGRRG